MHLNGRLRMDAFTLKFLPMLALVHQQSGERTPCSLALTPKRWPKEMLFHAGLHKTEKRTETNRRGKRRPRWISSILPLTALFAGERGRFYCVIKGLVLSTIADLWMAAFHLHFTSICLSSLPVWSLGLYWHRENRINVLSGFVWPKDT